MQTDDILILVDNDFASTKEDTIRSTKIKSKERKHFTFLYYLKFNDAQIKFESNRIVPIKKSHVKRIFLVTDYIINYTSFKWITKKKLPSKQ